MSNLLFSNWNISSWLCIFSWSLRLSMFQNSPLQVNFTSFSATNPKEGRSCMSPSLSRLARALVPMYLHLLVCQSHLPHSSVLLFTLLTAEQCNQNSKLISSGELLLRVMYWTVSWTACGSHKGSATNINWIYASSCPVAPKAPAMDKEIIP